MTNRECTIIKVDEKPTRENYPDTTDQLFAKIEELWELGEKEDDLYFVAYTIDPDSIQWTKIGKQFANAPELDDYILSEFATYGTECEDWR